MAYAAVLFVDWGPILRTVVVGIAMYVALVALLRISGSRTLASLNAFDFVVTVAIGAVFGRALTTDDVGLVQAVVAFALLVALQFAVGSVQVEFPGFRRIVTNPPHLLYLDDEYRRDAMDDQRITEDELRSAVRKQGLGSMDDVEAIVLETSGAVSVIETLGDGSALREITADGVEDFADDAEKHETGRKEEADTEDEAVEGDEAGEKEEVVEEEREAVEEDEAGEQGEAGEQDEAGEEDGS